MDFIKKNYEKILLGAVLFGLAAAVVYMLIEIPREKAELKATTEGIFHFKSTPLPAPDTARMDAAYLRVEKPQPLNFANGQNLFNPVQWQRRPDGRLYKAPTGDQVGPGAVMVDKISPLYTTINYESAGGSESNYIVSIQRDAELKPSNRRKESKYVSLGEKNAFFTLRDVKGPPDNPELTLELADTGARIKISPDHPYQRVDGYTADLEYKPEGKKWASRRVGDVLFFNGDVFTVAGINLVATNQYEAILSARSTGKKTTIRFNAAM